MSEHATKPSAWRQTPPAAHAAEDAARNEGERAVLRALRELQYGQVDVVVHSAQVVQITRSQKLRLTPNGQGER